MDRRSTRTGVISCLLGVFALIGAVAEASDPVVTWQMLREALARHPAVRAAESEVRAADGGLSASRAYPNPQLSVGRGRAEAIDEEASGDTWDLELTLPLWSPWRFQSEIAEASANLDVARTKASARRLAVCADLQSLFWRVAYGQQRLAVLESSREQMKRLVEIARLRVEMGEAQPMELSRLEILLATLELGIDDAKRGINVEREALALWLDPLLSTSYRIEADLTDLPELASLEVVRRTVLTGNLDLVAADGTIAAAEARLRRQRQGRFPSIAVGGFYERELDVRNVGGLLELDLPLWDWNGGPIRRAAAERDAARHERELLSRTLESDLQRTYAETASAFERATRYHETILPKARTVAADLDEMYRVGEVGLIDLLDSRRDLIEVESKTLAAYLDARLAFLRLATLMGGVPDEID